MLDDDLHAALVRQGVAVVAVQCPFFPSCKSRSMGVVCEKLQSHSS